MQLPAELVQTWITPGERVLDLGCGSGELLRQLIDYKQIQGYGIEIDPTAISACIALRSAASLSPALPDCR